MSSQFSMAKTIVKNFHQVDENHFRSAEPQDEFEFSALQKAGIKTIIDLENETGEASWEAEQCKAAGIQFLSYPMSGFWAPSKATVEQAVHDMNDPSLYPILVHCKHGWDRTGLICGMYRRSQGMSKWSAWGDMMRHNFHPYLVGLSFFFWTH